MITKLISAVIAVAVLWVAWIVYQKWENVSEEQKMSQVEADQAKQSVTMNPRTLAGMSDKLKDKLENSLEKAQTSAPSLKEWLKTYQKFVEDPRLAWIQLDYVVLVSQTDPAEAKRVFADVRDRTPPTSPVYPRIKQLEKTYE